MSSAPLPVGVIGVGGLGYHHARLHTGVSGARLVGVCDERRDRDAAGCAPALATD